RPPSMPRFPTAQLSRGPLRAHGEQAHAPPGPSGRISRKMDWEGSATAERADARRPRRLRASPPPPRENSSDGRLLARLTARRPQSSNIHTRALVHLRPAPAGLGAVRAERADNSEEKRRKGGHW